MMLRSSFFSINILTLETHFIELADGSKANNVALKKDTVEISLCDSFGNISVATLEDTLYVPSYPQNIFSVQAATAKGACVNFFSDSAQLVTKCGTKFNIERCGKLYYIQDSKLSSIQSSSIQSSSIQSSLLSTVCINHSRNIESWHRALGHCNKDDILKLERCVLLVNKLK